LDPRLSKEFPMRRWLVPASFLIALAPATAAFADGDCPPGSWFCEETTVQTPQGPSDGDATDGTDGTDAGDQATPDEPQPTEDAPPPKHKKKKKKHHSTQIQTNGPVQVQTNGPVVIYTNGGPVQTRSAPPQHPPPTGGPGLKPIPQQPWRERFGLNLRLEGLGFENANGETTGMGGLGLSFRWRPAPAFALDLGVDVVGGSDYYDKDRIESGLSISGMLFFNPKSHFQIYALGGLHLAHAEITEPGDYYTPYYDGSGYDYYAPSTSRDYLGLHAGLGVEWRVGKHFGIDVDGIGLIRTGINNDGDEFRNPTTGETTDTSAAGMLRAGVTFWW